MGRAAVDPVVAESREAEEEVGRSVDSVVAESREAEEEVGREVLVPRSLCHVASLEFVGARSLRRAAVMPVAAAPVEVALRCFAGTAGGARRGLVDFLLLVGRSKLALPLRPRPVLPLRPLLLFLGLCVLVPIPLPAAPLLLNRRDFSSRLMNGLSRTLDMAYVRTQGVSLPVKRARQACAIRVQVCELPRWRFGFCWKKTRRSPATKRIPERDMTCLMSCYAQFTPGWVVHTWVGGWQG